MIGYIKIGILISLAFVLNTASAQDDGNGFKIQLSGDQRYVKEIVWNEGQYMQNYISKDGNGIGDFMLKYQLDGEVHSKTAAESYVKNMTKDANMLQLSYTLQPGFYLEQQFQIEESSISWQIDLINKTGMEVIIQDFALPLNLGGLDRTKPAQESFKEHRSVNGNSSFCYWNQYGGQGNMLLLSVEKGTSFEYFTLQDDKKPGTYFFHASTTVDTINDSWRLPLSTQRIGNNASKSYRLKLQLAQGFDHIRDLLYSEGIIDVKVVPGMTLPRDLKASFSLRSKKKIHELLAEYPEHTKIEFIRKTKDDHYIYEVRFDKLGENLVTVNYGNDEAAYLEFFVAEPLETLIKKRSAFISSKQQIRDTSKWYDGLYSIWDMKNAELLNPDNKQQFPSYVVGGSDDPSNCKPLYVAEKNLAYPNAEEIAALEYYEENFVWGGLQRTGDEFPYPYGIYGSENWYENRSGKVAGYNSGGWGKERMWRTFDYTTHFAIYYNLYAIARDFPDMVNYLPAIDYLDRAYHTAIAYFEVPYNILMGEKWAFNGWTDWAYKQGNFHERYLLYIIDALERTGEQEKADRLRFEWEKKVKYFIYDDPWPFGSEMFVDRTAFESSYYIGEYAKANEMRPIEKLWYDKNEDHWYSHLHLSDSAEDAYMKNQLVSNLALRGMVEPGYHSQGTADGRLEYMCNMSGASLLDYAFRFSDNDADLVNVGYNSMLSTWALMNSGPAEQDYGYWYPGEKNDGAVGWNFNTWQKGTMYFKHIQTPRGPWRICGEIDHGLVSAVHDQASYVVQDEIFGIVAYGAELTEKRKSFEVVPRDGVRQRLRIMIDDKSVGLDLNRDGFRKDYPIVVGKDLDTFTFEIESRYREPHSCLVYLENLPSGTYHVSIDGNSLQSTINSEGRNTKSTLEIPVENSFTTIEITRQK